MSLTAHLGSFVAGLAWNQVGAPVRAKLRHHLLDCFGVMCAGLGAPESALIRSYARRRHGAPESVIVGCGARAAACDAALVNAFHGRIHTFDDTVENGPLHPGTCVVSAALAAAESAQASGRRLLESVLAGYEVAIRVCAAVSPQHYAAGFHTTGTCNTFGAAAAAAHAFGLDAARSAAALALAGSAAAGLRQYQLDGGMSDSALNGARAARAGVDAAQLAAAGLNGPQGILEGRFGFANMMGGHADWGAVENGLGRAFRFLDTSLKPYPTCRFTHGPIAALLALKRDHRVDAGQVEGIEITTFRQSIEVSDHPLVRSRSDAILSHQHAAAWALARGAPTLSALEETAYRADDVAALRARVTVTHDPALDAQYPARWPHRIVVRLTSGRSLNAETMFPPGGPDAPLDESVVISKLHELAHPVLGPRATGELMEAVDNLDCADNLQQLSGALAGTGG